MAIFNSYVTNYQRVYNQYPWLKSPDIFDKKISKTISKPAGKINSAPDREIRWVFPEVPPSRIYPLII